MRTAPHAININKMQIVNCAEAKICHFPFLDLGGREVLSFPSILCKIVVHSWVALAQKRCHWYPFIYQGEDEVFRLRLELTDPRLELLTTQLLQLPQSNQ